MEGTCAGYIPQTGSSNLALEKRYLILLQSYFFTLIFIDLSILQLQKEIYREHD
jgi:hypothetical protein